MWNDAVASQKIRVLVIEDEPGLVMTLTDRLEAEGYQVTSVMDGQGGFETAKTQPFDIILLDVMLPRKSGFDVCQDLRSAGLQNPILMLTARGQTVDKVTGLKLGADDYLCKPFDMEELLARMEAIIRRSLTKGANDTLVWDKTITKRGEERYKGFSINFSTAEVQRGEKRFTLSAQEYKLLSFLTDHPLQIISREQLLETVWLYGNDTSTRTVDVHIAWLRKKIEDTEGQGRHIVTVRGLGYQFIP